MQSSDERRFSEAMAVLTSVLGQEQSRVRIKGFWMTLRQYPLEAVLRAIEAAMMTKWYPFPQPADLIAFIEGSPEDRAEISWAHLWRLFDRGVSTYRTVYCDDSVLAECVRAVFGDWLRAGLCPRADSDDPVGYQTYHKTWVKTYQALSRIQRTYDPVLRGRAALEGFKTEREADTVRLDRQGRIGLMTHEALKRLQVQERPAMVRALEADV